jgi:hypothetical protein
MRPYLDQSMHHATTRTVRYERSVTLFSGSDHFQVIKTLMENGRCYDCPHFRVYGFLSGR